MPGVGLTVSAADAHGYQPSGLPHTLHPRNRKRKDMLTGYNENAHMLTGYNDNAHISITIPVYEPPHEKTNNLHMRKQRRRSALRLSAPLFSLHG